MAFLRLILFPLLLFALTVTPTRVPLKPVFPSPPSPNPSPGPSPSALTSTALNIPDRQAHFALFKNSVFSDPSWCPIANSIAVHFSNTSRSAQAKSQFEFCSHLIPGKSYVVLPTALTEAAFFPSWASTILWIVSTLVIPLVVFTDHSITNGRDKVTKTMWIIASYTTGQMIYWWYEVGTGIRDPHHAPWLNPSAFGGLLPLILVIIRFSYVYASIVAIIPVSQLAMTFYIIMVRFSPNHSGAIAYTLLPTFPVRSQHLTEECRALITDPNSDIYIDHSYYPHRIIQLVQFVVVVTWGVYFSFGRSEVALNYLKFNLVAAFVFVVWSLVGTCVLAAEGTPFTWNDGCGVVVIGMSSKMSYWDVRYSQDFLLARRIVRAFFALCKRIYFNFSLE